MIKRLFFILVIFVAYIVVTMEAFYYPIRWVLTGKPIITFSDTLGVSILLWASDYIDYE